MSFLSLHSRRLCTRATIARYLSQQPAHDDRIRVPSPKVDQDSFEAAGIRPKIASWLRVAFPNARRPTAMQKRLIRALTKNRDVLLQDDTGTGKSFAAMLGLLSKLCARRMSSVVGDGEDGTGEAPAGLLIVPHRDLAYQYLHWIHHMTLPRGSTPVPLTKYAQVFVRNVDRSTLGGLPVRMQEAIGSARSSKLGLLVHKPRILIATPNAVLELLEGQSEEFRPTTLSAVVVDEVDALLRIPSRRRGRSSAKKHVPELVQILDRLYPQPGDRRRMHRHLRSDWDGSSEHDYVAPVCRPQLVMISATLRNTLQSALVGTYGWVRRGKVLKLIRRRSSALPCHRLSRSAVHHVLVVSKTGDIKNIAGARPSQTDAGGDVVVDDKNDEDGGIFYDDRDDAELVDVADKELLHVPLAIDPVMLEAVAATVALDVPRIALLVLPATAAVRKIVFELRQLGVDAHPLDLVENEASRSYIQTRAGMVSGENPVLIVATHATVRGIDLPDLSHVMMLGVPEGRSGDAYLHAAGRVGRFGRRGKVITIVEEHKEERMGSKVVLTDGARKMGTLLSRIGVQASKLEHFG